MTQPPSRSRGHEGREPIAVVGMACRFPGGSDSPAAYWDLLDSGRHGIVEVPSSRWDAEALYDPDPRTPGKIYARHGGFIQGPIDRFDASFFGISPHEAWPMDPAQRLLLEVAWECLEHAGIPPHSLRGSDTGVFIGLSSSDYALEQIRIGEARDITAYSGLGTTNSFGSGRLSHFLGLEGPAISLDTACSSSMVTTLLAAESLWSGDCRLALVGGANVLLSPTSMLVLCKLSALSPSGRCRVFDAGADGYVRGEGFGVLALKRLDHAVEDGDRVLALIRGGAWGHDGRSSSLTVPRFEAQHALMLRALGRTGLLPRQIGYVEAHGTGTPVGDPVEAAAIGEVFGTNRDGVPPLLVGSGKTNIGHLEIASGVAAIIKVVLALQHRRIPAHLNLETPSPHVEWDRYALSVPLESTPWEPIDGRRLAGINSFGLSGTNAHLILEEAPPLPERADVGPSVHVLAVSGRSESSVRTLAARHRASLVAEGIDLRDFCHTANACRTHLDHRVAVVGRTAEDIADALETRAGAPIANSRSDHPPKLAFLCSGQGAQYAGMGRGLFESSPLFRSVIEQADSALRAHLEHPLVSVLYEERHADLIHETEYTQPALFALEMGLASLWRSLGIEPTHIAGHSLGEYVAATLAGVFDFEDGLALVAHRGRLMRELAETGAMAAVFATEGRVAELIADDAEDVALAAINGPENVVISGVRESVTAALERLRAAGIGVRELDVSHAFHSRLMDPMLDAFEAVVRGMDLGRPTIPLISNVTGLPMEDATATDPDYWRRHVRMPVRFADSVVALRAAGVEHFLEVGPHQTLIGMAALSAPDRSSVWIPSLRKGRDDETQFGEAVASLFESGVEIDWSEFDRGRDPRRITIPTYPFEGKRHWYPAGRREGAAESARLPVRDVDAVNHPVLGTRLRSPAISGVVYQGLVTADEPRYLGGYRIGRVIHAPLAVLLEAVLSGVEHGLRWPAFELRDVQVGTPLAVPRRGGRITQVILDEPHGEEAGFTVQSTARDGSGTPRWTIHVTGTVNRITTDDEEEPHAAAAPPAGPPAEVGPDVGREADVDDVYEALARSGVRLGASYSVLQAAQVAEGRLVADVVLDASFAHEEDRYEIHPTLLHWLFQAPAGLVPTASDSDDPHLPISLARLRRPEPGGAPARIRAEFVVHAGSMLEVDVEGYDAAGRHVVSVAGLRLRPTEPWELEAPIGEDEWSYRIGWDESQTQGAAPIGGGSWLVLGPGGDFDRRVAGALEVAGARVHRHGCDVELCGTTGDGIESHPDPANSPWARELLDRVEKEGGLPLDGVLLTLAADEDAAPVSGEAARDRAVEYCAVATDLARELRRRDGLTGRLQFVTRGAIDVDAAPGITGVVGSTLWGLQPVLRSEHPELRSAIVDVDPESDDPIALVMREVTSTSVEDRVAYRQDRRYAPRLGRFREPGPIRESRFHPDKAYLVSGGLGGLGKALIEWLAGQGVGIIAANARRAPDDATMMWIEEIRRRGTRLEVVLGDVSLQPDVDAIISEIDGWGLPLGGVFHAAGVLDDGLLTDMTPQRYRRVLAAKVAGAWNLHRAALGTELDHFVLFSSVAAFMGSPLQANYAAGNAFLASVAAYRREAGLPALSIDWGPWAERGMAAEMGRRERDAVEGRGMKFLDPRRCLELLEQHLRENTSRVAVMAVDWQALGRAMGVQEIPPFLERLVEPPQPDGVGPQAAGARRAEIDALPPDEKSNRLVQLVTSYLAEVLGLPPEQLPADADARDAGLDSLMALELRHRVETELGVTIPASALMDRMTPAVLASILSDLIASARAPEVTAEPTEWVEGEL